MLAAGLVGWLVGCWLLARRKEEGMRTTSNTLELRGTRRITKLEELLGGYVDWKNLEIIKTENVLVGKL